MHRIGKYDIEILNHVKAPRHIEFHKRTNKPVKVKFHDTINDKTINIEFRKTLVLDFDIVMNISYGQILIQYNRIVYDMKEIYGLYFEFRGSNDVVLNSIMLGFESAMMGINIKHPQVKEGYLFRVPKSMYKEDIIDKAFKLMVENLKSLVKYADIKRMNKDCYGKLYGLCDKNILKDW